jgi:excinuclease UvrABC nuclease subunit
MPKIGFFLLIIRIGFFRTLRRHRQQLFGTYKIYKIMSDTKYLTTSVIKTSASTQQPYKLRRWIASIHMHARNSSTA